MDEQFSSREWGGGASEHEAEDAPEREADDAPDHAQHAEFGTALHSLVFALALLTHTQEFSGFNLEFEDVWNVELTAAINNHVLEIPAEHLETYAQGALAVLLKKRPKRGATEHGTPFK